MTTTTMFTLHLCGLIYFLLLSSTVVWSENENITISLNKTTTVKDKELYGDFLTVKSNSTVQFTLTDVNTKVDYIIFQAHSHVYNITLYNNTLKVGSYVLGTNIGLYGLLKPKPDSYFVLNKNDVDVKVYVSVHGYGRFDPIPGGCNMESSVYVAPFMSIKYTKAVVRVDTPPAQHIKDPRCVSTNTFLQTTIYQMYLPEADLDEDTYFASLRNMITLEKIQEYGDEVPQTLKYGALRRLLSAYPGTGSIYVAVAQNKYNYSDYSVYVPGHTYACSPLDGCEPLDDTISNIFCALLVFVGLFTCYFGHRFFKTEMFLAGMFAGVIITYMLIPLWTELDHPALLGASILSGIFFGAIWVLFWWFYGIPVLAVFLTTMHLGFIVAAIIYYRSPGSHTLLSNDGTFWTIFVTVVLLTSVTLTTLTYLANIVCCAVLGGYATVFAFDHYLGSNLKYIVINTMRRAVVENFNYVILSPPFQLRDILTTLLWVMLAVSGFLFQHYHNKGRPPFPPPPRSMPPPMPDSLTYGTIDREIRPRGENNMLREPSLVIVHERTPLLVNF